MLTIERARELLATTTTEEHLFLHAKNVSAAMGGMAEFFSEDKAHWEALGYLHDYDYDKYPEEHLLHTEQPLLDAGVDPEDVRAILAHGYGQINDIEPLSNMEKSLYTVDELTGIIQAYAILRAEGIIGMQAKGFMKRFKDKRFAAKCDREIIKDGCARLGMEVRDVAEICIRGMEEHAEELGLLGKEEE
jgi:predicted hydrolase (HD superfamily)